MGGKRIPIIPAPFANSSTTETPNSGGDVDDCGDDDDCIDIDDCDDDDDDSENPPGVTLPTLQLWRLSIRSQSRGSNS